MLMELNLHKDKFVACPDYKSDEFTRFEQLYNDIQREYYKSNVKHNKTAHRRAREYLLEMYHLCRTLRRQVSQHRNSLPKWHEIVHPSWQGVED